ncbi:BatA domain-containing protein [Verrucomicrobiota bacterium]
MPVIIHLLNRLRFRSVKWAATMFLISATRSSSRHARLRHYLILLARTLIVLFFILALARPLAGGWLGMAASGSPDTIIILLDRSASMEATDPRLQTSKRERALSLFARAATETAGSSRVVLIENVLRAPQEIASLSVLPELSLASPTDTAADIPAMFRAALDYMLRNRSGRTEIWVASDFQKSNWRPILRNGIAGGSADG